MLLKSTLNPLSLPSIPQSSKTKTITRHGFCRFRCSANDSTQRKFPFKLPPQFHNTLFKFNEIDPDAVKKSLNSLLSRTHNFVNEVASPLVKTGKPDSNHDVDHDDIEDIFVGEQTVQTEMSDGNLSLAAVASIEQFSRMNGLTGQKMQKIFGALVSNSKSANSKARDLVEYCCFRFLSRDSSDLHPCLEDLAFQRLIFITMIAWGNPHRPKAFGSQEFVEETSLKRKATIYI